MYKLKLSLEREDDWKLLLTQQFPDLKFKVVNSFLANPNLNVSVVFVRTKSKQKLLNFMKSLVKECNVLEQGDDYMFLEVFANTSFFEKELFHKYKCFQMNGLLLHNGNVVYELGSSKRENLTALFNQLKKLVKVNMLSLSPSKFQTLNLSSQQSLVLQLAYENGYYDFPRGATAENLAVKLKLKPSTVNEHIRKAENKVMKYVLEKKVKL